MKKIAIGEGDFKKQKPTWHHRGNIKIRPRETTKTALQAAFKQIEDHQYEATLCQQGCTNIMKVTVNFDGKMVWAKS